MSSGVHTWYILAAYGVALVLLAAEVVQLLRRVRARARQPAQVPGDEA